MTDVSIFWFRRDLRLQDNTGLAAALASGYPVVALFIFDSQILDDLELNDPRINFIYNELQKINLELVNIGSSLLIKKGAPTQIWNELISEFKIKKVFFNSDYEPYAIHRDSEVQDLLTHHGIQVSAHKDQVIFEPHEVLKNDGTPYTVFTPYKNKWLEKFRSHTISVATFSKNFLQFQQVFPSKQSLGIEESQQKVPDYTLDIENYLQTRDHPSNSTSSLSTHLRFGTVSIRRIVQKTSSNTVFLSELIWREFFMQILFHFPRVIQENFKIKYNGITWLNNPELYKKWCAGRTGYPLVDAGMRQLNATGLMHNRVRMITASFLCKHLLTDWKWGEAYFAQKLLDYELSSNNGNWQWVAGTGCDAAPYFRVFNPQAQQEKFDPDMAYIKQWVPEFGTNAYVRPIVSHKEARVRAIEAYKQGLLAY